MTDYVQIAWNVLGVVSLVTPFVVRAIAEAKPEFGESLFAKVLLRLCNDFIGAKKKVVEVKEERAVQEKVNAIFPPGDLH